MVFVIFIITTIYSILIGRFIIGFDNVKVFNDEAINEKTKFSIIIPFRNEAENLPDLLKSLLKLDYPKHLFEILFVDDASEDYSVEIIQNILDSKCSKENSTPTVIKIIKNIRVSNSPKKDAITTAINVAKYEWIITTDADCSVPIKWLKTFDSFIQMKNPKMIIAPVNYSISNSFFEQFQLLDFLSLQSATISGFGIKKPFLCNGANLVYRKDLFISLNGFDGNTKIASGDDIFLMEKALKMYPENVMYLKSKNVLVYTKPQVSFFALVHQRLRWAAKTSSYNNTFGKWVGLIVLSMNITIIAAFLLTIIGSLRIEFFILIFVLKFSIDFALIQKSSHFFNQKLNFKFYSISSFLYPIFSVYIAMASFFFGYKWKDRTFKK